MCLSEAGLGLENWLETMWIVRFFKPNNAKIHIFKGLYFLTSYTIHIYVYILSWL